MDGRQASSLGACLGVSTEPTPAIPCMLKIIMFTHNCPLMLILLVNL